MKVKKNLIILVFLVPFSGFASEPGIWYMYFGQAGINERFGIHHELQYRASDIGINLRQFLARVGLNYHTPNSGTISAGYAFVENPIETPNKAVQHIQEHRLWQQYINRNTIAGRAFLENRFRVEQRWIEKNYKNRARFRIMANIPLNKNMLEEKTVFISAYNELFLHFEKQPFDRNRAYIALGYQPIKTLNLQAGFLNQHLGIASENYFQLGLFFNPVFKTNRL